MAIHAVALAGPRTGEILASTPVDPNRFVEPPPAPVGHGLDGLVDRVGVPGETVAGYVDSEGQPVSLSDPPPFVTVDDTNTVRVAGTDIAWPLRIDRSPDSPTPYAGPPPPAPSADGAVVYWTGIGPPEQPNMDFPDPTMNVIATLRPNGTGTWSMLPAGWQVVASDFGGTVVARTEGSVVQLARLPLPVEDDPATAVSDVDCLDRVLVPATPARFGELTVNLDPAASLGPALVARNATGRDIATVRVNVPGPSTGTIAPSAIAAAEVLVGPVEEGGVAALIRARDEAETRCLPLAIESYVMTLDELTAFAEKVTFTN